MHLSVVLAVVVVVVVGTASPILAVPFSIGVNRMKGMDYGVPMQGPNPPYFMNPRVPIYVPNPPHFMNPRVPIYGPNPPHFMNPRVPIYGPNPSHFMNPEVPMQVPESPKFQDSDFPWVSVDRFYPSFPKRQPYDFDPLEKEARHQCFLDLPKLRLQLENQRESRHSLMNIFPLIHRIKLCGRLLDEYEDQTPHDWFSDEDYEDYDYYHSLDSSEEDLDEHYDFFPNPILPRYPFQQLFPKVPDISGLPDNYDNATHDVHVVNGSRIEVNTTTNKRGNDLFTTFFQTKVINIHPDEVPKEVTVADVPEEVTTEIPFIDDEETMTQKPVFTDAPSTEVESMTKSPEETSMEVEDVNTTELTFVPPPVPAEIVVYEMRDNDVRSERGVMTKTNAQRSAYSVKRPSGEGVKGREDLQPPKDLSGDTLVNHLPGKVKGDKRKEPDAEIIHNNLV